jgi:serine protease AprX
MAVGADDPQTTYAVNDDNVPGWSSKGDNRKNPDIVAPGRSIVSLRDPGSYIDLHYPSAIVNDRFFKGSGTSQSAAVVSGAAALLIQQRPTITPDQLKALMVQTAAPLPNTDVVSQGAGEINLRNASRAATPSALLSAQNFALSTGTGSLDGSRGSIHVTDPNGTSLSGEQDIFGQPWVGATYSASLAAETAWNGGTFNGMGWSGMGWSGMSWSGMSWSGMGWSGMGWSGMGWSGMSWSGMSWSGMGWSGMGWSGDNWSGMSWSAMGWSGMGWSGGGWNGAGWTDADSFEGDIS